MHFVMAALVGVSLMVLSWHVARLLLKRSRAGAGSVVLVLSAATLLAVNTTPNEAVAVDIALSDLQYTAGDLIRGAASHLAESVTGNITDLGTGG